MSYSPIAKEQIPFESLRLHEVLDTDVAMQMRREKLLKAVQRHRLFYKKARIIFDTIAETKEVRANIWELTDKHVMLKGGISIPVCCIREVFIEGESNY